MKTTVEIADNLLEKTRQLATQEGTTIRALVEEGLRRLLVERQSQRAFRLRKASFKGNGLQPHLAGASWERLRDLAYEGRGT